MRPGWSRDRRRTVVPRADGPMLNLPRALAWLIGINVGIHLVRWLLPVEWDQLIIIQFGFIPAFFSHDGPLPLLIYLSPLTYMFLHGGIAHLVINMATLAAFGTPLERAFGPGRTVAMYLLTGLASALCHFLVYPASPYPMIGASGAISGLFAGTLLLMRRFNRRATDRRTNAALIFIWVGMTVLFALFDIGFGGDNVAWVAHLGGFGAGLLLFPLLQPRWLRAPEHEQEHEQD
jgi:membrane associated rhomboid family serine protease